MSARFAFRNLGILRYSRRHVVGDLWQWWVARPSELLDWQVRYLDIYLFYVYVVPSVL